MRLMKRISLIFVLMLVTGCRQSMDESRKSEHLQSFDYIWQTVKDKHYDPNLNGIDWDAAKKELRPRVENATNDAEARDAMAELLARLKLSHYAILPAGEKPKHEVGKFVPPIAKDSKEELVTFANLPEVPQRFYAKKLPENVQYFYLSIFLEPGKAMPIFRQAVNDARSCDGFILDLRHNPGGIGGMAMGMGNVFISQPNLKLGTMTQRDFKVDFILTPQLNPFAKPLAILIDEGSASTSEILAGGLQDIKRARIFGKKSPGMALPSLVEKLPNGDTFQFAVANYLSTSGRSLEGNGVTPDEIIDQPIKDDHDPVIEAAVKWIKSQTENK